MVQQQPIFRGIPDGIPAKPKMKKALEIQGLSSIIWRRGGPMFSAELLDGAKIVVHCKGGLGRAGTVASMLLLESRAASNGDDAMAKVREVRPGAIETQEQESFIRAWADHVKG